MEAVDYTPLTHSISSKKIYTSKSVSQQNNTYIQQTAIAVLIGLSHKKKRGPYNKSIGPPDTQKKHKSTSKKTHAEVFTQMLDTISKVALAVLIVFCNTKRRR